jgi:hypothetical protein
MGVIDIYNNNTDVDRTYGIKKVIDLISNGWGVDLNSSKTLDMFAGDGSFCTDVLLSLVGKNSVCWDIDPIKLEKINKRGIETRSGDIINSIKNNTDKFDIIHCDNPSSAFGLNKNKKYEYFDVIPFIGTLFDNNCIFIHNLNSTPYNFDSKSEWALERNSFYNLHDTSKLNIEDTINFHKDYFQNLNIKVKKYDIIEREMYKGEVYWWYLIWYLEK